MQNSMMPASNFLTLGMYIVIYTTKDLYQYNTESKEIFAEISP